VPIGFETKMTAISPLEGVVSHMLEKLQSLALNPVPQRLLEIQQDYLQRKEDLLDFLAELEKNPLGFSKGESEGLKKRAQELSKKLDVIALCLDIIHQSPEIILEIVGLYSRKLDALHDGIIDELSQIENIHIRDNFLKNSLEIKEYLKGFPLKSIRETVVLINQYCRETLEEERSYKNILQFFLTSPVKWIPLEVFRFVFEKEKENSFALKNEISDTTEAVRYKEIENKIAAYELQIVPPQHKAERLNEIQNLKIELNEMQNNNIERNQLLKRLEDLSERLISKPKDFGFFGEAKRLQPSEQ
jgi:hypothetical protein